MTAVPSQDFRRDWRALVRRAEAGERLAVLFHGRAIAALVPVDDLEQVAGKLDLPRYEKPAPREIEA